MKILITYYSATGNTEYLVNELTKRLTDDEITLDDVFHSTVTSLNDFDLIILSYPIYAFNAPLFFEKVLKARDFSSKNVLIIKTSSEPLHMNDASSLKIQRILRKQKASFIGEYHLLMPYHIIFRHQDCMVKQMLLYNERYLDYISQNIKIGKHDFITAGIGSKFWKMLGKLQRLGALINPTFITFNKKRCCACDKCLKACPVGAIRRSDAKLKINHKCLMCMKCTTICPKRAIRFGMLNHWQVPGEYHFTNILSDESISSDYLNIASRRFRRIYSPYYHYLDTILPTENERASKN